MQKIISRLPITRQFILLAMFGIILTISGLCLALKQSYDFSYAAKQTEIEHEDEEAVAIVRHFLAEAQSGALSTAEAQQRAIEAVRAIRYEGVNYIAIVRYDGLSLANANKAIQGRNIINVVDPMGWPITRAQLAIAESGHPGFCYFHFKKIGETKLKLKMSYNIGVPEWQWDIATGDFTNDLDAEILASIIRLAEIFVPLFLGYVVVAVLMFRAVSHVLQSLSRVMRKTAKGEFGTEIAGLDRRDDIGRMAHSLVALRQAGIDKVRLEAETESQRALVAEERARQQAEREAAARQVASVVSALAIGLEKLSNGDLLFRLTGRFDPAYEKLRGDFNDAMDRLQHTMKVISHTTQGVLSGAGEITSASAALARRTEQQAANLEQTAAALDQITATVGKTAQGAEEARNLVAGSKADADSSGRVLHETVAAMQGIEKFSKEIGAIIGVIDDIAFQTNLLALNAGIEAARAGDAGRGFAVVATEVRALSQRSTTAAKEIKELISASGRQVESGVKLVGETGKALGRIVEQVARLSQLTSEIAASAKDQAGGLAEVNSAVNQMDQVTQQNAAMVQQSSVASESLAAEATGLARLIAEFQIGDIAELAPVQPEARHAPPKPQAKPRPMLEAATSAGSWSEF